MADKVIIGVIPARYQSSRFPGKPLAIFNATRGGELEAFERVNFDTLFES